MQFTYKSARIDVTPAVTATGFQARARLKRECEGDDPGDEKYASGLGTFAMSEQAVVHVRQWAIDYCNANWF